MFQEIISKLNRVERFDRIEATKGIKVGEVENVGGGTELALQLSTGEALRVEPQGVQQLRAQWGIGDHFERLPRDLQAAELRHFFDREPKELTVRAVREPGAEPTMRAVRSGMYGVFDNADVLEVSEKVLPKDDGWEMRRDNAQRDEMVVSIFKPQLYDVSKRRVGDMVRIGLSLRNNEIGGGTAAVEYSADRLVCLNGTVAKTTIATAKQRHIYVDRAVFAAQLTVAIQQCALIGETLIGQMRAAHDLLLPNLDPEEGKLQRSVFNVLAKHKLSTIKFLEGAREALGGKQEASLFGLVQYLTDGPAKAQSPLRRLDFERAAGDLLALAA